MVNNLPTRPTLKFFDRICHDELFFSKEKFPRILALEFECFAVYSYKAPLLKEINIQSKNGHNQRPLKYELFAACSGKLSPLQSRLFIDFFFHHACYMNSRLFDSM